MPKEEVPTKAKRPYSKGGTCTLTCEPRTVYPKKDGELDTESPIVSKRWLQCTLSCDKGSSKKEDIWMAREVALRGKSEVAKIKQIKFFLFGFKDCDCGEQFHSITKIALDI